MNFIKQIFSISNSLNKTHKILTIFGIKIKFKTKKHIKTIDEIIKEKNLEVEKPYIADINKMPVNSSIGKFATINPEAFIYGPTKFGKFTTIAATARIAACNHPVNFLTCHAISYVSGNIFDDENYMKIREKNKTNVNVEKFGKSIKTDEKYYCVIGNDVYIGTNAVIMSGVTIGDGAVIGAGAIVTHDVPPYAIVAGVPAKILRYRFKENIIKDLLDLKWWDLDTKYLKELDFTNVEDCIKKLKFKQTPQTPARVERESNPSERRK